MGNIDPVDQVIDGELTGKRKKDARQTLKRFVSETISEIVQDCRFFLSSLLRTTEKIFSAPPDFSKLIFSSLSPLGE